MVATKATIVATGTEASRAKVGNATINHAEDPGSSWLLWARITMGTIGELKSSTAIRLTKGFGVCKGCNYIARCPTGWPGVGGFVLAA
jgi:hypothetical protein